MQDPDPDDFPSRPARATGKPWRPLPVAMLLLLAAADTGGCELQTGSMTVTVRREADDGFWGPTLEIAADDGVGPVNKYLAGESRPLEACWWTDLDAVDGPELVIGLGPATDRPAGVLVLDWRNGIWQPRQLAPLPAESTATDYRFLVQGDALRAIPVNRSGGAAPPVPAWQWAPDGWRAIPLAAEQSP